MPRPEIRPVDRGRGGTGGRPPRRTPVVTSSSATAPRRKPERPDRVAAKLAELEARIVALELQQPTTPER